MSQASAIRLLAATLAIGSLAATSATAQTLSVSKPDVVGVSADRLERAHQALQVHVDRGEVAGVVALVARNGTVVDLRAFGEQDRESRTRMRTDTLFRIASMSKPITTVAVLMLYEEGRFLLTDAVSKFIPAFKNPKVLHVGSNGAVSAVPAEREITIRDLLTHRSGLAYGFLEDGPVGDSYRKGGVSDGLIVVDGTIAENVKRLATQPLLSQPGKEWHYGLSVDVLGHLVEVTSGMSLDAFLRERIFKPLRMVDTFFAVPEAKWSRLATVYTPDGDGRIRPMRDPEQFGTLIMSPIAYYREPKRFFSGGAGLVSTVVDYWRFLQTLLNGGELDGVRLLSPKTVELMTASHTRDLPPGAVDAGRDFGLGVDIVTDLGATQQLGSLGLYSWGGIYGTAFWVDPKEKLIGVLMLQRYPRPELGLGEEFQVLTYQALVR